MQAWLGYRIVREGHFWQVQNASGYTMVTPGGSSEFRIYDNAVKQLAKCYAVECRRMAFKDGLPYREAAKIHDAAYAECIEAHTSEPRRAAA